MEAVESVVVLGGNGSAVGNVLWWERPEGQAVGVSVPGGPPGGDDDVSVVAVEPPGGGFVGGGAMPAPTLGVMVREYSWETPPQQPNRTRAVYPWSLRTTQ